MCDRSDVWCACFVRYVCCSQRCAQLMDEQREGERGEGEQKTAAGQLRRVMDDVKHKNAKVAHDRCTLWWVWPTRLPLPVHM